MPTPVKLVPAEASPRLGLKQATPEIKVEVADAYALTTDVRTPDIKLEAKAEAV